MTIDQCVSRIADGKISGNGCIAKGIPEDVNTAVQESLLLFNKAIFSSCDRNGIEAYDANLYG